MGVLSHLPRLLFGSRDLKEYFNEVTDPQPCNLVVRVVWDNPRLYEKFLPAMYTLWKDSGE